eukprot:7626712-Ditylum_brightwellii.AAC.1
MLLNHTSNEVKKWRGTLQPNLLTAHTRGQAPEKVKTHIVIRDLLQTNICLLPTTIDPFAMEGPALQWFRYGSTKTSIFDTSRHKFGNAVGTPGGIGMCQLTMRDQDMAAILPKANREWHNCHVSAKLFGSTYADPTPSTWSKTFLAAKYTWTFA